MVYTLYFKCKGKLFFNFHTGCGKADPKQYEAIACGLLLEIIDNESLSRDDKYLDLELLEYEEVPGSVVKVVWCAKEYTPTSVEVK